MTNDNDALTRERNAAKRILALEARLKEAIITLNEARTHLEYCGYGDKWERECARGDKLDEHIITVLENNKELLEAKA